MANRAYSEDFRLRVVAIASVRGVPEAAKQFGVGQAAVKAWVAAMPYDSKLKLAADLALSELTVEIANGTRKGKLSTDAGILMDKVARYYRPAAPASTAYVRSERLGPSHVMAYRLTHRMDLPYGVLEAELEARYDDPWTERCALVALQAYHRDHGCTCDDNNRWPMECPEPLPDPWAYLTSLGDLDDWYDARLAASDAKYMEQRERNRLAAIAWQQRSLDDETKALIAAAEAFLATGAQP